MLNNLNQTLYFIAGPTCIGKSSLAIRLAKKINGVIINADSMQVYSNLNILTARPSKKDLLDAKHELYGYVDAAVRYNVSDWCNDVLKIIKDNEKNNLPSIIVGGSGMYVDSLLNGLIPIPPIAEKYKNDSLSLLNEIGTKKFIEIIKNKTYKENELIIRENEIGDSIMLLLNGTVSITKALTIKINEIEKREKEFIKLNDRQYPFLVKFQFLTIIKERLQ